MQKDALYFLTKRRAIRFPIAPPQFANHVDAESPFNDAHDNMQRFKLHPFVRRILEGGEVVRCGAKTIPEGGLFSQPRLDHEGALLVGDSASFCNGARLKGVHMAIKSGMIAAEALLAAHEKDDFSAATLRVADIAHCSITDSRFANPIRKQGSCPCAAAAVVARPRRRV